jgi:hypothetical protein
VAKVERELIGADLNRAGVAQRDQLHRLDRDAVHVCAMRGAEVHVLKHRARLQAEAAVMAGDRASRQEDIVATSATDPNREPRDNFLHRRQVTDIENGDDEM